MAFRARMRIFKSGISGSGRITANIVANKTSHFLPSPGHRMKVRRFDTFLFATMLETAIPSTQPQLQAESFDGWFAQMGRWYKKGEEWHTPA